MTDMPWVRFFPSDWLAGTRGMSAAETGIYITLIATMYERGEPIAEDHSRLARLCGAPVATFRKTLQTLVDEDKIQRVDGGLWNKRVGAESELRFEKSEAARIAGKASAASRAKTNRELRKRRMAEARAKGTHTTNEWAALVAACGGKCSSCGSSESIEKDHIIPVYQGGSDGVENLQPLCRTCNAKKGPDNTDLRPKNWRGRFEELAGAFSGISFENQGMVPTDAERSLSAGSTIQKPEARSQNAASQQGAGDKLYDRLLEAASSRGPCHPNLAYGIQPIVDLLSKNYDLEADILPVIRERADPSRRSWSYFVTIIVSRRADRQAIPDKPQPKAVDWTERLRMFRENDLWPHSWGPKPGEPGCDAPAELVREMAA